MGVCVGQRDGPGQGQKKNPPIAVGGREQNGLEGVGVSVGGRLGTASFEETRERDEAVPMHYNPPRCRLRL